MFRKNKISRIQSLASQWCLLGMMAGQFAKHLLQLERGGARNVYVKAMQLEAWLACALAMLTDDLSEYRNGYASAGDCDDMKYLHVLFCMLTTLLYFSRSLMQRVKGMGRETHAVISCDVRLPAPAEVRAQRYAYLDSS